MRVTAGVIGRIRKRVSTSTRNASREVFGIMRQVPERALIPNRLDVCDEWWLFRLVCDPLPSFPYP